MKKFNSRFGILGWLLFISVIAMGAKIGDNNLRIGDKSGSDITIDMGDNGQLKWNDAEQKLKFSNDGGTSEKEIGSGGGGAAGVNILENADFESGSPPANWTLTGSGTFTAETVAPGFGAQSGNFNASAASELVDSDLVAVPLGLESRNCNATIQYKYDTGSGGDYKLQVVANTAGLIAEKDLAVTVDWVKDTLHFTCPSSDSIRLRISSTVDGGIILLDNATLGKSDTVQLSQDTLVTSAFYDNATNCDWSRTSAAFGRHPTDADCPAITVAQTKVPVNTTDDDLPTLVYDDLPAGLYYVQINFGIASNSSATAGARLAIDSGSGSHSILQRPDCGISQGTTAVRTQIPCNGVFRKTAAGATTITLDAFASGGPHRIFNGDDGTNMSFNVWKIGEDASEAINLETVGEYWDVNIGGANPDLGTSVVSSYTHINDAGLDMVINPGSRPAQIPCETPNPSTGLTCSVGQEHVGIVIDTTTAGFYEVCGSFSHRVQFGNASTAVAAFQWVETSNTSVTILQEGNVRMQSGAAGPSTDTHDSRIPNYVCGYFNFATAGQKTLRLMYEQSTSGASINQNILNMDRGVSVGQRDMHVWVRKINQQTPTPVFTDLQDSLAERVSGGTNTRTCEALITFPGGVPTVTDETCVWVDSLIDQGAGNTDINFVAGTFTGTYPMCTCTISEDNNSSRNCKTGTGDNTFITVRTIDDIDANQDQNFVIRCSLDKP